MRTDIAVAVVSALLAALMLWAAWRLADGEMFFACTGVFVAAFWGAICGCAIWAGICRWDDRQHRDDYCTTIFPGGRR